MPNIILFPKIEEVFEDVSEFHQAIFFPLLTVDLASIGKGNGKAHFITVHGNGDPDVVFSETNLGYNFIKFKIVGDKYSFDGDLSLLPNIQNNVAWYKEAEAIYKEHKDKYCTKTEFTKTENEKRRKINFDYYFYIKGVINYWLTRDQYQEKGKFIQGGAYSDGDSNHEREPYETLGGVYDDEYGLEYLEQVVNELDMNFDEMNFVGSVKGYHYSALGEGEILLFVNKKEGNAFQYFNWS